MKKRLKLKMELERLKSIGGRDKIVQTRVLYLHIKVTHTS